MKFTLAVTPGDGVGPEIVDEAIKVLKAIGKKYGHSFNFNYALIGASAIDKTGEAMPKQTLEICKAADAVILGAVGHPKYDDPKLPVHPEDGLLALRKSLGLFANLRPVKVYPMLVNATNFKPEVIEGVDFVFVRELTGGVYFARPKRQWTTSRGRRATDSMTYSEQEIERLVRVGFELAMMRKKKLVSVDKANVLQSSRLWRQVTSEVAKEYPEVSLENMLVDATSMRLIQNPKYFDVLVAENMFGDILTDEASMVGGSMGMLPSASIAGIPKEGEAIFGLYEPIHGSAPRRAGQNIINPIATILSIGMMLRYSLNLPLEADAVDNAVYKTLEAGYRTYDIWSEGKEKIGTSDMGDQVAARV